MEFNTSITERYLRNSPIKWKKMGFAMLPTSVVMDIRLSRPCLMVYWILVMHLFKGRKYCFPSLKIIAEESRYSRPSVVKAIKELKKCGYLEVEGDQKSGKVNKYFLKAL